MKVCEKYAVPNNECCCGYHECDGVKKRNFTPAELREAKRIFDDDYEKALKGPLGPQLRYEEIYG